MCQRVRDQVIMSVWALLGVVLRENWYMDHVMVDGCEVEIDDVETAWTMSERDRWGKTGHERSSGQRADITRLAHGGVLLISR